MHVGRPSPFRDFRRVEANKPVSRGCAHARATTHSTPPPGVAPNPINARSKAAANGRGKAGGHLWFFPAALSPHAALSSLAPAQVRPGRDGRRRLTAPGVLHRVPQRARSLSRSHCGAPRHKRASTPQCFRCGLAGSIRPRIAGGEWRLRVAHAILARCVSRLHFAVRRARWSQILKKNFEALGAVAARTSTIVIG